MAEEAERLGARMRERRKELGLTQREVADLIPGNTEGKDVSRWENGRHRPQGDTLTHIAEALRTDLADLYAGPAADREEQGPAPDPFATSHGEAEDLEEKVDQLVRNVGALAGQLAKVSEQQKLLLRLLPPDERPEEETGS